MSQKNISGLDLFDLFTENDKGGEKRKHPDRDESEGDVDSSDELSIWKEKRSKNRKKQKGNDPVVADELELQVELAFKVKGEPGLGDSVAQYEKPSRKIDDSHTETQTENNDARSDRPKIHAEPVHFSTAHAEDSQLLIKHQIRHQVALPPGWNYIPINEHHPDQNPAHTFSFELDPFQKTSIYSIERNESVLVSAHTSAGKTVIAEYAIALSLKNKQRVIYTSPIKALSNQKYREFTQLFGDVGLMTGDVTINPNAGCVVMTTEILRSMLYRGSDINREVAWIIFDEIHYMRDASRGVVWEEAIILLPDTVRYVFLSATIPNAMEFAEWICKIHKQPCHVVYTDFRPTPLQHYIFPSCGDGIYLAVDEKGTFLEDNFQKALSTLENSSNMPKNKTQKDRNNGPSLLNIIKLVMRRNCCPLIVFSFSKRECEFNAKQLSKFDLNTEDQKAMVDCVFKNAVSSLSDDEKQLPQIVGVLPLLQRGIGIHHSGLLPLIKEVIEILFQEGLIKVLFATETFSIGLNMPAKTVIFTSLRKWDGKEVRWITSGEYIQMSGRAGRRGLDDRGIVILMLDEKIEPPVAREMLKGLSDPFNSAFYLSYTMILNLIRMNGISPERMLEMSFFQFQACLRLPRVETELNVYKSRYNSLVIPEETLIAEYHEMLEQIKKYEQEAHEIITLPQNCLKFIQPGRFVHVKLRNHKTKELVDYGWGLVMSFQNLILKRTEKTPLSSHPKYVVFTCIYSSKSSTLEPRDLDSNDGEILKIPCPLDAFHEISPVMIKFNYDLKSEEQRGKLAKVMRDVKRKFPEGLGNLDPIKTMGITDEKLIRLKKRLDIIKSRLSEHPIHSRDNKEELLELYKSKLTLTNNIKSITKELKLAHSAVQLDELKHRRRVLRRLEYTSADDLIEMKGRVACEISAGDELLVTEMIFDGVFNDLTVDQIVALLSCFTFQEKSNDPVNFPEELSAPFRALQETARKIARVSQECKISINEEEYIQSFRPELMEIVYYWCRGVSFSQICKLRTDIFEGSIIRAIRRLEELLRQLIIAAKSIGNTSLEDKFADGIVKIKRDIVFTASLYL